VKRIAITMGEPGGIGPEVIVKALCSDDIRDVCIPLVIGSAKVMRDTVKLTGLPLTVLPLTKLSDSKAVAGTLEVFEVESPFPYIKGKPSKKAGKVVVQYINTAVELALKKKVRAVVTAPVSKTSLKMAGQPWPGHTELLADLTDSKTYAMMFISRTLKIILSTIHVPLKDVPGMIHEKLVMETINLAKKGGDMLGMKNLRIAVAGLNPHAGESGIMGEEEINAIVPAIRNIRRRGISVSGPHPPDVVFYRALKGEYDIVVSMYHDQGLIPFKMLAFDTGVNVTVGLPIIRTSPDHGTGFDIAWKNKADPTSMIEAIKLACQLKLRVKS
jgi:4-hydroxythreonine-4-phosphate dehydrogenase